MIRSSAILLALGLLIGDEPTARALEPKTQAAIKPSLARKIYAKLSGLTRGQQGTKVQQAALPRPLYPEPASRGQRIKASLSKAGLWLKGVRVNTRTEEGGTKVIQTFARRGKTVATLTYLKHNLQGAQVLSLQHGEKFNWNLMQVTLGERPQGAPDRFEVFVPGKKVRDQATPILRHEGDMLRVVDAILKGKEGALLSQKPFARTAPQGRP